MICLGFFAGITGCGENNVDTEGEVRAADSSSDENPGAGQSDSTSSVSGYTKSDAGGVTSDSEIVENVTRLITSRDLSDLLGMSADEVASAVSSDAWYAVNGNDYSVYYQDGGNVWGVESRSDELDVCGFMPGNALSDYGEDLSSGDWVFVKEFLWYSTPPDKEEDPALMDSVVYRKDDIELGLTFYGGEEGLSGTADSIQAIDRKELFGDDQADSDLIAFSILVDLRMGREN